jgi:prevent-host-death family protein
VKTVGAYEAKTHLPRLLEEVARGETITITKHGVPIARLIPAESPPKRDAGAVIDAWLRYRDERNITLEGITIREMIEEGRM